MNRQHYSSAFYFYLIARLKNKVNIISICIMYSKSIKLKRLYFILHVIYIYLINLFTTYYHNTQ